MGSLAKDIGTARSRDADGQTKEREKAAGPTQGSSGRARARAKGLPSHEIDRRLQQEPLPTVFTCLFCNHEKSVSVKMDKKAGVGELDCKICGQRFQCGINYLSAPIDVYSEWVDAAGRDGPSCRADGRRVNAMQTRWRALARAARHPSTRARAGRWPGRTCRENEAKCRRRKGQGMKGTVLSPMTTISTERRVTLRKQSRVRRGGGNGRLPGNRKQGAFMSSLATRVACVRRTWYPDGILMEHIALLPLTWCRIDHRNHQVLG